MNFLFDRLGVEKENRGLLSVIYLSFFTSGMMSIILGALLPHIRREYGLDYTQGGLLLSAHQLGSFAAVILAGFLPYILGRKNSTLIMASGLALGMLLMTITGNPFLLLLAFAATGISRGTFSNICNTVAGEAAKNKTSALNILHAVFAVGALLGPVILFLNDDVFGGSWKSTARIIGALGLVILVLIGFSKLPGRAQTQAKAKGTGSTAHILRSKSFWFATGILFFYMGAEASITGWFVSYFAEAGILSPNAATFTPTILWSMVLIGRLACAAAARRFNKKNLLMVMGALFTLFFILLFMSESSALSLICLGGIGLSMAGICPTTISLIDNLSSTAANGLCIGIANLGAIIMPGVVGAVANSAGLSGGIALIGLFCAGMAALMLIQLIDDKIRSRKTL